MMTTCWVVSPMLHDTESFVRLRADVAAACTQRSTTPLAPTPMSPG
jgi:hypothetical protein